MINYAPFMVLAFFLILILLEIPIAYCMIITSIGFVLVFGKSITIPFTQLGLGFSFSLLAIFFFVIFGNMMNETKISDYLVNFVREILNRLHIRSGRTGSVVVLSSAACGPFTGSVVGTTTAVGSIMYPQLNKYHYDPRYSTSLIAYSGILGSLIPPSIGGLLYAVIVGLPVLGVWFSVCGVGLLYALVLFLYNIIIARKRGYDRISDSSEVAFNKKAFIQVLPALIVPIIVFGSIYGGIATPTEAGAIGFLMTLLLGIFYYKTIRSPKQIIKILFESSYQTAIVMFLIAASFSLSYTLVAVGSIRMITNVLLSLSSNKYVLLLIVQSLVLILGCFLDTTPVIIIVAPIASAALIPIGIHPYHLASIFIFTSLIGLVTPPVGASLYAASAITKIPMSRMFGEIVLLFVPALIVMILITFFPWFSFFVPKLLRML